MALTSSLPVPTMDPPAHPAVPQLGPPYSPSLINFNQKHNMSTNGLTEALLLLTGVYINVVQPEPRPVQVGFHAVFPDATGPFLQAVTDPFSSPMRTSRTLSPYPNISKAFEIHTGYSNNDYVPNQLLHMLCDEVFPENTITLFYLNNHLNMRNYLPAAVKYLPQMMESMGLPIISYDTQFSFNSRPALSVQLAPTMGQMMDVFFAFLRRFSWSDFSFLCTLSQGCQDEIAAIRLKVLESHRKPNVSVYGVDMFSFNLLSFVNFTDGGDEAEVTEKLKYELHQDTRILLVHGDGGEVKDIMAVAERLGLVGREYVWIYTASSITLSGTYVARSYPLGSFVIGYDSKRENMADVAKMGLDIWLEALNSLASSPDMKDIDFETGFSCGRSNPGQKNSSVGHPLSKVPLKWKYGPLLYEHMLKVKLPGNLEFDHHGVLKSNKFWIKNIQLVSSTPSQRSKTRSRFGGGRSGASRRPIGGGRSRGGGSPFGQSGRGGALSSRQQPGARRGSLSSLRSRNSNSGSLTRDSSDARSDTNSGRNLSTRDRTSSRRQQIGSSSGGRSPLSSRDSSRRASTFGNRNLSRRSAPEAAARSGWSGYARRDRGRWRRDVGGEWSFHAITPRLRTRRSMRRKRARNFQEAKTIAEWDGHNLSVTGITWPGGASQPPKGKPEKYTLRVATWHEDPQVVFTEMRDVTGTDEDPCDANSLPCKIYDRDDRNQPVSNNTREVCCTGLCIDLLKKLGDMLHFDVELFEVAEGAYGSPLNDNRTEWNGMIGKLVHGEADMAMGALSITPQRAEVVDFSVPFLQTGITIIVAIREGAISATAFLEPYDYPSWTLILAFSVHATGASIFIFEWLSPYGLDQGKTPLSVHKFSLFRSFWLIWAMLFGASVSTDQPRGCASRFLANIWALFAVVFCASYTANLAAFMITKDDFYDLSGIQDWRLKNPNHRQPPFKFASIEKSATDLNIKENYKEIHKYMKQNPQTDVKAAIRNLKDSQIQAFIYDSTTLEYEVGKDDGCRLKTVGKRIAETGYGVAFPRKSQWTQQINKALLWLQEDGEIERLQKFWLAGACHKKKETGVSSHTLGILNFTSAFILLGAGVVLGLVLLILEHCYFRFGRKSLKKWDSCGCCSLVSLSMGQSLTFEQSVMEAIDLHRQHKCKDPLCETQLWKVKHELDLALIKIGQLRKQLAHTSALEASGEDHNVPEKLEEDYPPYTNGSARRRRRQRSGDDVNGKGQDQTKATRQPLLALEGAKNDEDSDDDPTYSSAGKYTPPTSAIDVKFAPQAVSGKAPKSHKGQRSQPQQKAGPKESSRETSGERSLDRQKKPSKQPTPLPRGVSSDLERGGPRQTGEEEDLPLPPPPSFEEAMAADAFSSQRSPASNSLGGMSSPRLPSPPPPLSSPPVTGPSNQGPRPAPAPSPSTPSSLPPPARQQPASERPESFSSSLPPAQAQPDPAKRILSPAPKPSSSDKKDRTSEMPLTHSQEDDNDINLRRQRNDDGTMYVNVDNIIGKETYF